MPLYDVEFQAGVTTILEAMAMERTVVCSRTKGQTDVIRDGVTGVYVTPEDVAALRATIVRLLGDPETTARIGAEARRHVEAEAEVSVYARRLAALTLDAIRRQRSPA
jgi:glycosyltransferase involved in cell wall biosynthesis